MESDSWLPSDVFALGSDGAAVTNKAKAMIGLFSRRRPSTRLRGRRFASALRLLRYLPRAPVVASILPGGNSGRSGRLWSRWLKPMLTKSDGFLRHYQVKPFSPLVTTRV